MKDLDRHRLDFPSTGSRTDPQPVVQPAPEQFFRSYSVALLYPLAPRAFDHAFAAKLEEALEELTEATVRLVAESGTSASPLRLRYHGAMTDAGEPPEWHLAVETKPPIQLSAAAGQSWWWREGRRLVPEVRGAITVSDHRDSTLDGLQRMRRFRRIVAAVEEVRPALAVLWTPSQQLVDPRELLTAVREAPFDPLPGPVNVRYYRTLAPSVDPHAEPDEEFLMDTLGLAALGLTDLQCHFRGLEPDSVSQVLFETALYLLERGASVIGEGHSIQGPGEQDRWIARRRRSLSEPARDVLDLDPGFPFAGSTGSGSPE